MTRVGRGGGDVVAGRDGGDVGIPRARGGWWHDYVCPVHHVELLAPRPAVTAGRESRRYPCPHGCELTGEPWASAGVALEHQGNARRLRSLAVLAAAGDATAADEALDLLAGYAELYARVGSDHEGARDWMVPGKLFHQVLTEAIWAAGVANAVWTMSESLDRDRTERLTRVAAPLLTGLHDSVAAARHRTDLGSNYTAWFNAAGALTAGALGRLGSAPEEMGWIDGPAGLHAQVRSAVLADGWEWEGSTYYHAFVLLAYLYTLRGTDPADLPADVVKRITGMIDVLHDLAAPDGVLPALHDSPYRRAAAEERLVSEHQRTEVYELAEVVTLSRQLAGSDALDGIARWCDVVLDDSAADLLGGLDGWFSGRPPTPDHRSPAGSVLFDAAGFAVLRPADRGWMAVVDFGPHGGSHGHLDKLALYLYGDGTAWQPDPGVVPYGSRLRSDVCRTTRAHPTFSVDGAEQRECTGRLLRWVGDGDGAASLIVSADAAYPGVVARRHLIVVADGLLDVLELQTDGPRDLALHLRPAVPVTIQAGAGGWRTDWAGAAPLAARHVCSVGSRLEPVPGWAPADDPTRPNRWLDWTTSSAEAVFATVWLPGLGPDEPVDLALEVTPEAVDVRRPDGTSTHYSLTTEGAS